jgi:hypothetical protein
MFLQLPFEAPGVEEAGTLRAELGLAYSNSILLGSNAAVALDIHAENAQPTVFLRCGLADGVELQLGVPVIYDYGGFLDSAIEFVEGIFHAVNPERRRRPRDDLRFRLTRPDGTGLRMDGAGGGLGDVWASVKVLVAEQVDGWPAVAVRAALKAPTGRLPHGSGEMDVGASLNVGWGGRPLSLWLQLDAAAPTSDLGAVHLGTRVYGAAQLGAAWRLGEGIALHLQGSAHASPLRGTGLPEIDAPTYYLLLGSTFALARSAALEVGVVENVFSPGRGADFTVLLGLRAWL